jgi:hypothetical protein
MYAAIWEGHLTEKAFYEWLANRSPSPVFDLPVKGKRTKVTFDHSDGVAYIGIRNKNQFDVRFEVDDYSVPERHIATFKMQTLNQKNFNETVERIENLFLACNEEGADARSSNDLLHLAHTISG